MSYINDMVHYFYIIVHSVTKMAIKSTINNRFTASSHTSHIGSNTKSSAAANDQVCTNEQPPVTKTNDVSNNNRQIQSENNDHSRICPAYTDYGTLRDGSGYSAPNEDRYNNASHCRTDASFLTRSRVMTQIVAMLYFAGFISTINLVPQYMIHRLSIERDNGTADNVSSNDPCEQGNSSSSAQSDAIQEQVAKTIQYYTLASCLPTLLVCLIAGGYSDVFGRRPLMLLAIFSGTLRAVLTSLIIMHELPVWVFYIAYIGDGLSGSWTITFIMFVSSITDTTKDKRERVFWISVLGATIAVVSATLLFTMGVMIDNFGCFAASLVSVAAGGFALIVGFFCYPETVSVQPDRTVNVWGSVRTIYTYFMVGGSARDRRELWTCLGIFIFTSMPPAVLYSMDTLYMLHRPFRWSHEDIGFYNGGRTAVSFLVCLVILSKCRRCCQPECLAIVGLLFQAGGFVLEATASTSWQLILVPIVSIPGAVAVPVIRSMLSFLASDSDQGAINSSIAVVDVLINIAGILGVLSVYSVTLSGPEPGAVYFLMASFCIAAILLYFVLFGQQRRNRTDYERIISPVGSDNESIVEN